MSCLYVHCHQTTYLWLVSIQWQFLLVLSLLLTMVSCWLIVHHCQIHSLTPTPEKRKRRRYGYETRKEENLMWILKTTVYSFNFCLLVILYFILNTCSTTHLLSKQSIQWFWNNCLKIERISFDSNVCWVLSITNNSFECLWKRKFSYKCNKRWQDIKKVYSKYFVVISLWRRMRPTLAFFSRLSNTFSHLLRVFASPWALCLSDMRNSFECVETECVWKCVSVIRLTYTISNNSSMATCVKFTIFCWYAIEQHDIWTNPTTASQKLLYCRNNIKTIIISPTVNIIFDAYHACVHSTQIYDECIKDRPDKMCVYSSHSPRLHTVCDISTWNSSMAFKRPSITGLSKNRIHTTRNKTKMRRKKTTTTIWIKHLVLALCSTYWNIMCI